MQYVQIAMALLPYIIQLIEALKKAEVIKDPSEFKAMLPECAALIPDLVESIRAVNKK